MIQRAQDANARLRKGYPKGFALDATHHPHVTMLQQFVRTADLDRVLRRASQRCWPQRPTGWKLKAIQKLYLPLSADGLAGIVIEPTANLTGCKVEHYAMAPFTVEPDGTSAAFFTTDDGRDIQRSPIDYVGPFCAQSSAGQKFNPHVTTGEGRADLKQNARRAVRNVHVLADRSIDLPAWQFWNGPKATQGLGVEALRPFCVVNVRFGS